MKKIFGTIAVAAVLFAGHTANKAQNEARLTNIALANVEALANSSEEDDNKKYADVYYPKPGDPNYGYTKCVCTGTGELECC